MINSIIPDWTEYLYRDVLKEKMIRKNLKIKSENYLAFAHFPKQSEITKPNFLFLNYLLERKIKTLKKRIFKTIKHLRIKDYNSNIKLNDNVVVLKINISYLINFDEYLRLICDMLKNSSNDSDGRIDIKSRESIRSFYLNKKN